MQAQPLACEALWIPTRFASRWKHSLRDDRTARKPTPTPDSISSTTTDAFKNAACWAHAHRVFYDIHQANNSPIAAKALERISQFYTIEAEIPGRPPKEHAQIRQARSETLLEELRA